MVPKLTRREWAAILGTAGSQTRAQTADAQSGASLAAEAREELAMDIQQVAKFPLPPGAEPAFVFKP